VTTTTTTTTTSTLGSTSSTFSSKPGCRAASRGEECYEHVNWVRTEGIYAHPSWYPTLTASSTIDEVQADLYKRGHGNCPRPCHDTIASVLPEVTECHTALPGEQCYAAIKWARMEGIRRHPHWYPGLTTVSSGDEFQAEFFRRGHGNCPMPCQRTKNSTSAAHHGEAVASKCHTTLPGERCYVEVKWAMHEGLRLHPHWYPGLNQWSSVQEFQAILSERGNHYCPKPCPLACHTATQGDECYASIQWAKLTGVHTHAEWYPGLTASSSLEDFQEFMFREGHTSCSRPCPN
jgi:hypothetical protein